MKGVAEKTDPVRAHLLATCLLNTGRAEEAERVLGRVVTLQSAPLQQCLALALARQGKTDQAVVTLLGMVEREPGNERARKLAVSLLHRHAVRSINSRDTAAAAGALGDALRLEPTNPSLRALLARIENVVPIVHLKANEREQAIAAWEKAQAANPANARIAHSLALAYFFWASSLEGDGRKERADQVWHKAMINWALARYADPFWEEWERERNAVYPVGDGAIEKLRQTWSEQLGRKLEGSGGNAAEARRLAALRTAWWLEDVTACAISELKKTQCPSCAQITRAAARQVPAVCAAPGCGKRLKGYPAHDVPAVGPLGKKQFGLAAKAAQLASHAAQLPNGTALSGGLERLNLPFIKSNADVLKHCLAPSAQAFSLVARRQFDEALALLR